MLKRCELSSLTAIFGSSEEKTEDSDKLMELYWNRAELKKEFAGMRKEQYRLQDRIKEQEGKAARVQQKLDHLEGLLVDPEWAHNVVVHYQLRGLGKKTERKLARFAEQLKQQREQKKHDSLLEDWNEERKGEARDIEGEILLKRDLVQQLEDQLQSEQRRLTSMNAFVRLFRGRSTMKLIDSLATKLEVTIQEDHTLHDNLEELMNRKPPDHEGLGMAAKRSINLMILAFAQQLYIQFDKGDIADLIKESTEKSIGAINYGTDYECQRILERIRKSTERLDRATEFADVLKKRAIMLGERAKFPGKDDAVPIPGTVASLIKIDANGMIRESDINIAGENYWGISNVFSR
jgi:DNA-directed RNA polymerase subunit L